jgi:hypothetical protein
MGKMSEQHDKPIFIFTGDSTDCRLSEPDEHGVRHWITTTTHWDGEKQSEPEVVHGPTPLTDVLDALVRPMLEEPTGQPGEAGE